MLNDFVTWAPRVVLALALPVFLSLFFQTASYGRHTKAGARGLPARLGWMLMEAPSVFAFAWAWTSGPEFGTPLVTVLGLTWLLHYVQRTFVFASLMRDQGRVMPASTMVMAIVFNLLNSIPNGMTLRDRRFDVWVGLGLTLFLVGFAMNLHADHVLRTLRRPGETGYSIPQGGLYTWVSSPNYLGEMLEWLGFAIAAQTLPAVAFFVFTCANLVPRAWSNHAWYRAKFPDYPTGRRALIPRVW